MHAKASFNITIEIRNRSRKHKRIKKKNGKIIRDKLDKGGNRKTGCYKKECKMS